MIRKYLKRIKFGKKIKALIIIIIILSNCFAQSSEADSLDTKYQVIGFDKVQHTAFSCLWTLSSQYVLENKSGFDKNKALPNSVGLAITIGLAKEINDAQTSERPFDWGDMIANAVGIAIAAIIITH